MRARLGFSIATSVDPDILLLDEVLATGDANFRAKSKTRVIEIVSAAKAVVLVTHDMNWVTEYCNRAVLIEKGLMVAFDLNDDIAPKIVSGALERGVILNATGPRTVRMVPPLIITNADVDEAVGVIGDALKAI